MNRITPVSPGLAAVEIKGVTRSAFLVRGAVTTGALLGASAVSPFVSGAMAQGGTEGDLEVLNFALTLEYLEAAFYEQGLKEVSGLGREVTSLAEEIQSNEQEHVEALTATIKDLGGMPVEAPGVDFGDAFASPESFLELAQTLEDTGVGAYNGAAPSIESADVLGAAGGIVQVEARHAALIRLQNGEMPAPEAFDKALEQQAVLDAVMPFIKS